MRKDTLQRSAEFFMQALDLDLNDPNFADTPRRVAEMYQELFRGHHDRLQDEVKEILSSTFPSKYNGIVSITGVDAVGVCPHHLLPVYYHVDVGYIPSGRMVGLSKIPRMVKLLAARPVLQEDFTEEITNNLRRYIKGCQGTIALVRGHHSCVSIRGVRATNCDTVTSSVQGVFATDASAKSEFLSLVNGESRQ